MSNLSSQSYSVFVQESDFTNTKTTLNQRDFLTLETLTLKGHLGFARECTMSEPGYHCKIIFLSTPSHLLIHIETLTAKVVLIFFFDTSLNTQFPPNFQISEFLRTLWTKLAACCSTSFSSTYQ